MATAHQVTTDVVPADYLCPITNDIMKDPVMDREGNSYEREAVSKWLAANGTSPITRNPLVLSDLVPNRALRSAIEDWLQVHSATQSHQPRAAVVAVAPVAPTEAVEMPSVVLNHVEPVGVPENQASTVSITITPPHQPASGKRKPIDMICVIDISGSMGDAAIARDADGNSEDTGLSVLDVVKHATRTMFELLQEGDRAAIVTFNQAAGVFPLVDMDSKGKSKMRDVLTSLHPGGGTNIWAGLYEGMQLAKGLGTDPARNRSVLLLTDGRPTSEPPRGTPATLKNYLAEFGGAVPFSVSTYGFGYNLDSVLLSNVADACSGSFGYIPDCGMVGTVFVNAAANILATFWTSTRVTVFLPIGATLADASLVPGAQVTQTAHEGRIDINIGALCYGQPRTVAFDVVFAAQAKEASGKDVGAAVVFAEVTSSCLPAGSAVVSVDGVHFTDSASLLDAQVAVAVSTIVSKLSKVTTTAASDLPPMLTRILSRLSPSDRTKALVAALTEDVAGEVTMGLTNPTLYERWGGHYARSLASANRLQQCNNFKDKSVQLYGGKLFTELQSAGEKAFLALPPPTPTVASTPRRSSVMTSAIPTPAASSASSSTSSTPKATPAKRDMKWAYNRSGGCVAPTAQVALADGTTRPACDIVRGDVLLGGATVRCTVKVAVEGSRMVFTHLAGGLLISPYHPIRLGGEWVFPTNAATKLGEETLETPFMWTFVLDGSNQNDSTTPPCAIIDGVDVVSFAHKCGPETPVVGHAFFGTGAALAALERLPGYATEGVVTVGGFLRDSESNLIVGLV